MGMTGRISSNEHIPRLESIGDKNEIFPPAHTHLIIQANDYQVAYSDPRRFGGVSIDGYYLEQWNRLAHDAIDPKAPFEQLIGISRGIKSILLDQRKVICGVGNWIADEVLYQTKIHPEQTYLTSDEVCSLKRALLHIVRTGIDCYQRGGDLPPEWIFHQRWKKGASKNRKIKDYEDRNIDFIQSGGRSSAIVPSIQKLVKRKSSGTRSDYRHTKTPPKPTSKRPREVIESSSSLRRSIRILSKNSE